MSAIFALYKISPADYLGSSFELKTEEAIYADVRRRLNLPEGTDVEAYLRTGMPSLERKEWSDDAPHVFLDVSKCKSMFKGHRGWRRIQERLDTLPYKRYKEHKYLGLDMVEYSQGWFLKKRFFRKETTFVYCTTKKQMEDFFKQYMDYSGEHYWGAKYTVDKFLASWQDGMVFECCW